MINRIQYLLKKNNINSARLCTDLKISKSSVTDWKKGKGKPSVDTLIKISQYFNVTLDWLILGEETNPQLSNEENEILSLFCQLNELGRAELKGYAKGILTNSNFHY